MKKTSLIALAAALLAPYVVAQNSEEHKPKVKKYLNLGDFRVTDYKNDILGERDQSLGVRVDLIEPIRKISLGDKNLEKVLLAQTRVRDLFLTSSTKDEVYDSYLYIEAGRLCLVGLGYGHSEAVDLIQQVAEKQVNTKTREMAAIRSERTLRSLNRPNLALGKDYAKYCKYYGITI